MKYPQQPQPQPKPLVRFRVNGGGVFVHTGFEWIPATPSIMTNIADALFGMVRYAKQF